MIEYVVTFSRNINYSIAVYDEHSRTGLCNFGRVRHRKWGNEFQRKYWRNCNYKSRLPDGHASKGLMLSFNVRLQSDWKQLCKKHSTETITLEHISTSKQHFGH